MLDEGITIKWRSSQFYDSSDLPANDFVAYVGEFALTRCAGILQADGGPCPIIAIFRPDVQLGALLHVYGGDAEVDGDNHEELINKLLDIEGTIVEGAICHVFLDETPIPGLMKPEYETA